MTEAPDQNVETSSSSAQKPIIHGLIVFVVVAFLILLSLRDFMSLMAVLITLSFAETKALYLFLITRSALFSICAVGVWKKHQWVGLRLTNGLLIVSFLFNYYLAKIDPVEKSRATDAMLACLVGITLLYFLDYFPKAADKTKESQESQAEDTPSPNQPPSDSSDTKNDDNVDEHEDNSTAQD